MPLGVASPFLICLLPYPQLVGLGSHPLVCPRLGGPRQRGPELRGAAPRGGARAAGGPSIRGPPGCQVTNWFGLRGLLGLLKLCGFGVGNQSKKPKADSLGWFTGRQRGTPGFLAGQINYFDASMARLSFHQREITVIGRFLHRELDFPLVSVGLDL